MKVIDLLNKLYNNEEVPKRIKLGVCYLTLNENKDNYIYDNSDEYYGDELIHWYDLGMKVEIIEEDKPALAREELENRIENALEFLETQYNTYPSGQMWREALKNTLLGKEADNVYEPFEEDKKIEKLVIGKDDVAWCEGNMKTDEEMVDIVLEIKDKINEIIDKLNEGE